MKNIIFDTDLKDFAGDDFALAFAIKSGRADLSGVTTVRGNVGYGAKVAKKYLNLGGYGDVPVFTGSQNSFDGSVPENSYSIAGALTTEEQLDEPSVYGVQNNAPEFIVDSVRSRDNVIVATGPLTNIARALGLYPKLAGLTEVVVTDYNMLFDSPAARAVLSSGMPVTVIPSNILHDLSFDEAELQSTNVDELMKYVNTKLWHNQRFFGGHHLGHVNSASLVGDPLTVAAVLSPEILETEDQRIAFEQPTSEDPKEGYKVKVAKSLDAQIFRRDFLGTLSRRPQDVYRDNGADIESRARAAIALGMPNEALGFYEDIGETMPPKLYITTAERFVPQTAFGETVKWYSKLLSSGAQVDRNSVKERLKTIGDKLVLRGYLEDAAVCYSLLKI